MAAGPTAHVAHSPSTPRRGYGASTLGQTCTGVITRTIVVVENFFFIVLFYCLASACPESAVPAAESVEAVARLALDLLAVRCAPLLKLLRLLPAHAKTKPRRAGSYTQAHHENTRRACGGSRQLVARDEDGVVPDMIVLAATVQASALRHLTLGNLAIHVVRPHALPRLAVCRHKWLSDG